MINGTLRKSKGINHPHNPDLKYYRYFDGEGAKLHNHYGKNHYYHRFVGYSHHAGELQNTHEYFKKYGDEGVHTGPDLRDRIFGIAILKSMSQCLETGMPVKITDTLA